MLIRLCKTALVATVALFFTLVAFGNLTDYESNWRFVQHVLAMDTIFEDSTLRWRAITDPTLQEIAYWTIIVWEVLTALVLWWGSVRLLFRTGEAQRFQNSKSVAVVGLTLGALLYGLGFLVIGGEWFAMWQSPIWNGQEAATRFLVLIGFVTLLLLLEDR